MPLLHGGQVPPPSAPPATEVTQATPEALARQILKMTDIICGDERPEEVRALLEAGADPNYQDSYGFSLLWNARKVATLKVLLEFGAKPVRDGAFDTELLEKAAWGGYDDPVQALELFISLGGDIRAEKLQQGEYLVECAERATRDEVPILQCLSDHGLDIPSLPGKGRYALLSALHREHWAVADFLLAHGADVSGPGCSPVRHMGDTEMDCPTSLMAALKTNRPKYVRALLERGANPRPLNAQRQGLWHIAAAYAGPEILALLPKEVLDVEARDLEGFTPLMTAGIWGNDTVGAFLLEQGADPNARDCSRRSVLMLAALGGNAKLVERLIAAGADVNARDPRGWTPLFYAAQHGCGKVMELLLAAGADVDAEDALGYTAISHFGDDSHIYVQRNSDQVLLRAGAKTGYTDR